MRTIRIYQPGDYELNQTVKLSEAACQHVGVVLRMKPGEQITLFRGDDYELLATILTVRKREVTVQITQSIKISRESPRDIHLAQAISKGDKMELVIQKAVELGVNCITPITSQYSVVRLDAERMLKKQAQWQAIAIAACEQSGRNVVPIINPICSLNAFIQQCDAISKWILVPTALKSWRDYTPQPGNIAIIIGPEGGLSDEEVNQAMLKQFQPLCLGPRVLRTETAAIAALCVLQAAFGDL